MKLAGLGRHESQIVLLSLLGPLPALFVAHAFAAAEGDFPVAGWIAAGGATAFWVAVALSLRARVARALESTAGLIAALRQGDLSVRGRRGVGGTLGSVFMEINGLADSLSRERVTALEASALLAKVMAEIDVGVFAFDRARRLELVNRAGERLIAGSGRPAKGRSADDLGLGNLFEGPTPRTVELTLAGRSGQWELRRNTFRLKGLPHELIVLSDLRRALREEERVAWQRIIRVMSHEINNSLAPIRSLASSLQGALKAPASERPGDFEDDLARGLAVIDRRAAGLDRFTSSYSKLAKLPRPRLGPVDVGAWVRRVVDLERRIVVRCSPGPRLLLRGDGDQLDQALINLVRNAADAALETGGGVEVGWQKQGSRWVEVTVTDEGPGVTDTDNLFVPFFTTKAQGSGIGLILSRQICEAHRGSLTLESRTDRRGAIARLRLPA